MKDVPDDFTARKLRVLAVDDEEVNLLMLDEHLSEAGYDVMVAHNGHEALDILFNAPFTPDIVLLDRMMPNMDGIEVLRKIKNTPAFEHLPVIMQTAAASTTQVVEGIEAGAYYYLTKPFDGQTLLAIVNSAGHQVEQRLYFEEQLIRNTFIPDCITFSHFRLRTMEQAQKLAIYLARLCPLPKSSDYTFSELSYGFSELLINALEHGNLGITYDEKTELMKQGKLHWLQEVERRSALPENIRKFVDVEFTHKQDLIVVSIKDQGEGFNWQPYLDIDPNRSMDNHGRGIALAKVIFGDLEFLGNGNEVLCTLTMGPRG